MSLTIGGNVLDKTRARWHSQRVFLHDVGGDVHTTMLLNGIECSICVVGTQNPSELAVGTNITFIQ